MHITYVLESVLDRLEHMQLTCGQRAAVLDVQAKPAGQLSHNACPPLGWYSFIAASHAFGSDEPCGHIDPGGHLDAVGWETKLPFGQ